MPLLFTDAAETYVNLGTLASIQNIEKGSLYFKHRPDLWPAAGLRAMFYINGNATGFRDFSMSGIGGTIGARLLIDRASVAYNVGATPANTPHHAAGVWCDLLFTWDMNAANSDQHIYGGSMYPTFNPLVEVGTYANRDVGSGTATSSNSQNSVFGGFGLSQGYPGRIGYVGLWINRQLTLNEAHYVQRNPRDFGVYGQSRVWLPGEDGGATVVEKLGSGDNGTIVNATVIEDQGWEPRRLTTGWIGQWPTVIRSARR